MQASQIRRVQTPLGEITYTLTRKKVKNLNLRITGQEVRLSAGERVSLSRCDQLILEKAPWIFQALSRQERRENRFSLPENPKDGDWIFYLGEPLSIYLWDSPPRLDSGRPYLPQKNPRKALEAFLDCRIREVVLPLCEEIQPLLPVFSSPAPPVVSFRTMTSRWGSCSVSRRRISFNRRLIHLPLSTIRAVVVHEYAHLAVPNHSPQFYSLVHQLMPDYSAACGPLKG